MRITPKRIKQLTQLLLKNLFWIVLILFLLDTYVYFFAESKYLQELFNIASEKTPATWISSTLLLIIAVQSFFINYFTKEKLWKLSGYFFIYLSLDDASYVHEQVSSWISQQSTSIANLPSYGWLYVIAPVLAAFLLKIFFSLYKKLQSLKITFVPLLLCLFLLANSLFLDFFDGYTAQTLLSTTSIHYLRVLEEILEIVAFAFLMQNMSLLLVKYLGGSKNAKKKITS